MQLTEFFATNVHGYLDIHMNFNSDISFIVGANGSGKTTALRMISSLLTPSLRQLYLTEFDESIIFFNHENTDHYIKCNKDQQGIVIKSSLFNNNNDQINYNLESDSSDLSASSLDKIINLPCPIIIGLDRSNSEQIKQDDTSSFNITKTLFGETMLIEKQKKRHITSNGLNDAVTMIFDHYRLMRAKEETVSDKLKKAILDSIFTYVDQNSFIQSITTDNKNLNIHLIKRKSEVSTALEKAGLLNETSKKQMDNFFKKLEKTKSSTKQINPVPIEHILNKAQLDRIHETLRILDSHQQEIDAIFKPINTLVNTVNSFFEDSGKKLIISNKGDIEVQINNNKTINIEQLSSGEKQILILFTCLIFKGGYDSSKILLIDEPELSLHLKWQKKFVTAVISSAPNTQLVLATHSPEIVGAYKHKAIPTTTPKGAA